MLSINQIYKPVKRPVRVLQYGTGNFLRAFAECFIADLNTKGFNGNAVLIKTTPEGGITAFNEQDNLYTVLLRGIINGGKIAEPRVIDCLEKVLDIRADCNEYAAYSASSDLKFIISNTTEAGITFNPEDKPENLFTATFPGKLTDFLYKRYQCFNGSSESGLYILPLELIDDNAAALKLCVDKYISLWGLPEEFRLWNDKYNYYCNTLVDRIVPGFPKDAEEIYKTIGYSDKLLVAAEPYALFVIEDKGGISKKLNFKGDARVVFASSVKPYKSIKVRLLNGAHTASAAAALLSGITSVGEAVNDALFNKFISGALYKEILPVMEDKNASERFAAAVLERFANPYITHLFSSICLNSISKWKVRVWPSLKEYYVKTGKWALRLTFSLAALIALYSGAKCIEGKYIDKRTGISLSDDTEYLRFFASLDSKSPLITADLVLGNSALWGEDLAGYMGLKELIVGYLAFIFKSNPEEIRKFAGGLDE